ncbi:hypothetical protein ACFLYH_00180 [Candidatus Dependentiae bacterium]
MQNINNPNSTILCHNQIYDSSYDYTIYNIGFIFNTDDYEDTEEEGFIELDG